jgi:hypothetical protein
MASYNVSVKEQSSFGKSVVDFLQSIPQSISFEFPKKKEKKKSQLYYELDHAFGEVRLMLDGKKKKKTAQEFLEEIRREKANELRNSNN